MNETPRNVISLFLFPLTSALAKPRTRAVALTTVIISFSVVCVSASLYALHSRIIENRGASRSFLDGRIIACGEKSSLLRGIDIFSFFSRSSAPTRARADVIASVHRYIIRVARVGRQWSTRGLWVNWRSALSKRFSVFFLRFLYIDTTATSAIFFRGV